MKRYGFKEVAICGVIVTVSYQVTHEIIEPDHYANPHTHQEDFNPFATRTAWEWMSSGNSIAPGFRLTTMRFRPYTRVTIGDIEDRLEPLPLHAPDWSRHER